MKRSMFALSGVAAVALLTAACGSGGGYAASSGASSGSAPGAGASSATPTTLALSNSKLGQILADSQGRSLYLFGADNGNASNCTSAGCVAEWPPLIAGGTPQAGAGLATDQVGAITRPDGKRQVTFAGHPLYYFAGDTQPGMTAGQDLNDNGGSWYVVKADGTSVDGD